MNKTTDELNNELKEADDIRHFIAKNEDELITKKISAFLNEIIDRKNLKKSQIIEAANLHKSYGYELFSGKKEMPSRDVMLRLAIAMGLDLDETQKLLKYSELPPLYARNSRDSVIIYAINNKKNVMNCNLLLEELGHKSLAENNDKAK